MAIVIIEYKWDPEDNDEIGFLGTRESIDEATKVIDKRYDEVWANDVDSEGITPFSYDIRINGVAVSTLRSLWGGANPQWLGKAVGYAEYDNEWTRHMWFMFDENLPTRIML